jgi:cyclophilin family peptidyl-prolyl cis-trans isomerase
MTTRRVAALASVAVMLGACGPLTAQTRRVSAADSALLGRILLAEDRRDSSDRSLAEGARHADPRVRVIAQRARGRISDPRFAARDSLPPLPPPPVWPEPAWRLRYRALASQRADCGALRAALSDSALPVRLRAADLVTAPCASDDTLIAMLREWIDAGISRVAPLAAAPGGAGRDWRPAAHALTALAQVHPLSARSRISRAAMEPRWQLRMYAARAAAVVSDTARLRALARDTNDNVREVAIEALSQLTGHADDSLYIAALDAEGAQAVRAAAIALKGPPRADARAAAGAAFERWVARANTSARDARIALLEAAARPPTDDRPPALQVELPARAVALALGSDVRLRVTLAPSSGGGAFIVRLRGDVAPIMAARILELANRGYYNGLTWHRVEHDFVVQGGSPGANEYVGLPQFLRDELGTLPHVRGTVGMSTRGHDTGDAQWFINLRDNLRLGRDYTVFAEVVEGMDVVDGILEGAEIATIQEVRGGPR